ncbi:DUF1761 domain-containing protein [Fulvivirga ulvae]|uniref:DUF1761 domain-containing protein n=1 Tax=Fulvivirga ulvae TaxID=2904245 RepID=UPI001F3CEDB8|nr:DUF1761 domain-containing protein [Fulvivirga ulvae]UII33768.1 DUF1761 domain-containing protein [Fulvivirga ulvae]
MGTTLRINHVAVWVAALLAQAVAPLIYSEVFFGIRWVELNELTEADFSKVDMGIGLSLSFISSLAEAYMLAWLFKRMHVTSAVEGLKISLLVWLAFIFLEITTQNYFSVRSFELTLIDESVVLVKYEIAGILLGSWKKYSEQ